MKNILSIGICLFNVTIALVVNAQAPLNLLAIKGTHNSYACCGGQGGFPPFTWWDNSCPVIHNPPYEQMDDWNVWAFELDFSVKLVNGNPTLIVGHNGSQGDDTWATPDWGVTLREYLVAMRDAQSFPYRPVIVKFEKKEWGSNEDDAFGDAAIWGAMLDALLLDVFTSDNIYGPNAFATNSNSWPSVPQLAGKIIPYANGPSYSSQWVFGNEPLARWPIDFDSYINSNQRNAAAQSGQWVIIASDQYQEVWTFDFTAPPNPIVVKQGTPPIFSVTNLYGHSCGDFNDVGKSFLAWQQGTFRFPFNHIAESVDKAFSGWTLLIGTGNYPEKITITKPLTLKANGEPVFIGN